MGNKLAAFYKDSYLEAVVGRFMTLMTPILVVIYCVYWWLTIAFWVFKDMGVMIIAIVTLLFELAFSPIAIFIYLFSGKKWFFNLTEKVGGWF